MWIGTNVKLHTLYWTVVALFDVVHNLYIQIRSQTRHRSDIKKISDLRSDIKKISDLRSDIKKISDLWLAQVWYLTDNAWLGVHYLQHSRKLVCLLQGFSRHGASMPLSWTFFQYLPSCCWRRWVGDVAGMTSSLENHEMGTDSNWRSCWHRFHGGGLVVDIVQRELGTDRFHGVRCCVAGLNQRMEIISARTCNADHGKMLSKVEHVDMALTAGAAWAIKGTPPRFADRNHFSGKMTF